MIQEELNERTFGEIWSGSRLGKGIGSATDKTKEWLKGTSKGRTRMPYVPLGSEKGPKHLAYKQAVDGGLEMSVVDDLIDSGVAEADLSRIIGSMVGTGDLEGFDPSDFSFGASTPVEPSTPSSAITTADFLAIGDNPTEEQLEDWDLFREPNPDATNEAQKRTIKENDEINHDDYVGNTFEAEADKFLERGVAGAGTYVIEVTANGFKVIEAPKGYEMHVGAEFNEGEAGYTIGMRELGQAVSSGDISSGAPGNVLEGMVDGEGKPPPGPWYEKGKVYELEEGDTDEEYSVDGLVKESREQKSDLLMKRWGYVHNRSK